MRTSLPLLVPIGDSASRTDHSVERQARVSNPATPECNHLPDQNPGANGGESSRGGSQFETEGHITEDEDDEDKFPSVGTDSDSASRTDHSVERQARISNPATPECNHLPDQNPGANGGESIRGNQSRVRTASKLSEDCCRTMNASTRKRKVPALPSLLLLES